MTLDIEKILTDLRAEHLRRNNRRPQTALDVPAAVWLWHACERERATRVLELGSGFSSWTLRHWQRFAGVERGGVVPIVWTVDDEPKWLETTRIELLEQGFSRNGMISFDDALSSPLGRPADNQFDLVFVDLDSTATRRRYAEQFVRWVKPGGLLVLDDWHMPHYRGPMTERLAALGMTVEPLPETTDEWGRYMAVGRKPV